MHLSPRFPFRSYCVLSVTTSAICTASLRTLLLKYMYYYNRDVWITDSLRSLVSVLVTAGERLAPFSHCSGLNRSENLRSPIGTLSV